GLGGGTAGGETETLLVGLRRLLLRPEPKGGGPRAVAMRHPVSGAPLRGLLRYWELKLLSLVIAFTLWLFVVGGEKGEIVLSARVEYLNVPSGLMLAGPAPDTVDVQVQGSRSALRRLTSDDFRAQVNVARVGAGDALVA